MKLALLILFLAFVYMEIGTLLWELNLIFNTFDIIEEFSPREILVIFVWPIWVATMAVEYFVEIIQILIVNITARDKFYTSHNEED